MKLMATKHQRLYQNAKMCYIFAGKFEDKNSKHESFVKFGTIVIMQGNIEVLHIAYITKNIVHLK